MENNEVLKDILTKDKVKKLYDLYMEQLHFAYELEVMTGQKVKMEILFCFKMITENLEAILQGKEEINERIWSNRFFENEQFISTLKNNKKEEDND